MGTETALLNQEFTCALTWQGEQWCLLTAVGVGIITYGLSGVAHCCCVVFVEAVIAEAQRQTHYHILWPSTAQPARQKRKFSHTHHK